MRHIVLPALLVIAVVSACGGSQSSSPMPTFDANDPKLGYFATLNGDTGFPGDSNGSGGVESVATSEVWSALVADARARGLAAMSPDDRAQLLAGAVKAYLKTVSSIYREVTIDGVAVGSVSEQYVLDPDGFYSLLESSQTDLRAAQQFWGFPPVKSTEPTPENRLFVALDNTKALHFEVWKRNDDQWSCNIESPEVYATARLVSLLQVLSIPRGSITAEASIAGVETIGIEIKLVNRLETYWLDKSTLWPVAIDYGADESNPPSRSVLTNNKSQGISRPGDPSACSGS